MASATLRASSHKERRLSTDSAHEKSLQQQTEDTDMSQPRQQQQQEQQQPSELAGPENSQSQQTAQHQQRLGEKSSRAHLNTPDTRQRQSSLNRQVGGSPDKSPNTPGNIAAFDWEDFEARYDQALSEANLREQELLEEFEGLVKYFNVWASAAPAHDNERAVKRLQTRERYVKIAEQSLLQKKKHLTEVVRAFQSALALLSQS